MSLSFVNKQQPVLGSSHATDFLIFLHIFGNLFSRVINNFTAIIILVIFQCTVFKIIIHLFCRFAPPICL